MSISSTLVQGIEPANAATAIENQYAADGPFLSPTNPIQWVDGTPNGCADLSTAYDENPSTNPIAPAPGTYTYVYPSTLGFPEPAPVIVWGNGTGAGAVSDTTCLSKPILEHLASWGYFVISPNEKETGSGVAMRAAITHLQQQSAPGQPFHNKVNMNKIMVAGHSQGTIGAFRARVDTQAAQPALIDSILAISTPSRWWVNLYDSDLNPICELYTGRPLSPGCTTSAGGGKLGHYMPTKAQMNNLGVRTFFMRGSSDTILGNDADHPTDWYPSSGPFISGSLRCADHGTVAGIDIGSLLDSNPAITESTCNGFGYVTAWAHYTLVNAGATANARFAFLDPSGGTREISTNTGRWERLSYLGLT